MSAQAGNLRGSRSTLCHPSEAPLPACPATLCPSKKQSALAPEAGAAAAGPAKLRIDSSHPPRGAAGTSSCGTPSWAPRKGPGVRKLHAIHPGGLARAWQLLAKATLASQLRAGASRGCTAGVASASRCCRRAPRAARWRSCPGPERWPTAAGSQSKTHRRQRQSAPEALQGARATWSAGRAVLAPGGAFGSPRPQPPLRARAAVVRAASAAPTTHAAAAAARAGEPPLARRYPPGFPAVHPRSPRCNRRMPETTLDLQPQSSPSSAYGVAHRPALGNASCEIHCRCFSQRTTATLAPADLPATAHS